VFGVTHFVLFGHKFSFTLFCPVQRSIKTSFYTIFFFPCRVVILDGVVHQEGYSLGYSFDGE